MSTAGGVAAVPEAEQFVPYRSISKAAVISFVLGLLSAAALLTPVLLLLPLVGVVFGLAALINIRRFPTELAGRFLAWTGLLGCGLLAAGAMGLHSYIYVTEVPEGYQRIAFSMLEPEKGGQEVIPASAKALDGQRVFVKGYVHPGVASQGEIREFILVPDMGTCCFGGQPKLTDMISVKLKSPLRTSYNQRKRKLAGTLRVNETVKSVAGGLNGGLYELEADYLK